MARFPQRSPPRLQLPGSEGLGPRTHPRRVGQGPGNPSSHSPPTSTPAKEQEEKRGQCALLAGLASLEGSVVPQSTVLDLLKGCVCSEALLSVEVYSL